VERGLQVLRVREHGSVDAFVCFTSLSSLPPSLTPSLPITYQLTEEEKEQTRARAPSVPLLHVPPGVFFVKGLQAHDVQRQRGGEEMALPPGRSPTPPSPPSSPPEAGPPPLPPGGRAGSSSFRVQELMYDEEEDFDDLLEEEEEEEEEEEGEEGEEGEGGEEEELDLKDDVLYGKGAEGGKGGGGGREGEREGGRDVEKLVGPAAGPARSSRCVRPSPTFLPFPSLPIHRRPFHLLFMDYVCIYIYVCVCI